jgi:hypothetical protein
MFSTAPAAAASDEKGPREMTSGEKPERESSKKKATGQKKLGEDVDIDLFCCSSSLLSTLSHFFGSPSSFSLKNPSNLLFEKKEKKGPAVLCWCQKSSKCFFCCCCFSCCIIPAGCGLAPFRPFLVASYGGLGEHRLFFYFEVV